MFQLRQYWFTAMAAASLTAAAAAQQPTPAQALPPNQRYPIISQQEPQPPSEMRPVPPTGAPNPQEPSAAAPEEPKWGPTAPEDIKPFKCSQVGQALQCLGVRVYGWADSGYTYSTAGRGILTVEPRENRFGDEYLVNQLALVVDKPLDGSRLSFGFNSTLYAGADAALLHPLGGIDTGNPRFGLDFRQLYGAVHLPIFTEGGLDVRVGRMGTVIGYESALAPYRPFYSNDYQWFYAEDGAFTGVLTTLHLTKQLELVNGITLGANTFFVMRGTGPCYLGQVNYWLQEDKRTLLSASVYLGNNAIFAAPGLAGTFDTTVEVRLQHEWTKYFFQVVQTNMGWDANVPGVGTGSWYGVHTILVYHLLPKLDTNFRAEWFDDVGGTRTGFNTNYSETTFGFDYHPIKAISFRPEIRGDYAGARVFRNGQDHAQLTLAFDVLGKF